MEDPNGFRRNAYQSIIRYRGGYQKEPALVFGHNDIFAGLKVTGGSDIYDQDRCL